MTTLQPVRGTHDLYGETMERHRLIINKAIEIASRYGFQEIKTPIFEFSNVFQKTLGDASDIVNKEMYTFEDKGGDSITLRPEGTAPVMRSFISEGMSHQAPIKFIYEGPMFRYERPQKGRYRQFYQLGVELIGPDSCESDLEVLSLSHTLLSELGIIDKVKLNINTIGDTVSRIQYREELVHFYNKNKADLSEESLKRLEQNPMRILDSKNKQDIAVNQSAPEFSHHLTPEAKQKFEVIQSGLNALGIPFQINSKLVRGLDYYSHLVFEFRTDELGSQDAVLSGGRYDDLCELMGGPKTPAVGWGAGVDRIGLLMNKGTSKIRPISFVPLGKKAEAHCLALAHSLRRDGFYIDMAYSGNMSNRMKKAAKNQSVAAVIIGDSEIEAGEYTVKNLDTGVQVKIKSSDFAKKLSEFVS